VQSKSTIYNLQSTILDEVLKVFPGLNAIGYREVLDLLSKKKTLIETIEAVQTNSRHYAKRQLTWFRRYGENI